MAPSLSYLRLLGRSGRSCTRSMSSVHQDSYIDAIESRKRSRKSAEFDTLGTWDTRLNVKIDEDATLRTGHIVPQIEVSLVGEATHLGRRNYQEDRARVEQLRSDLLYLAVFDGHGGEACAEYCHHNFHRHILHHLEREQDLDVVLRKSFHDVNRSFERWCQCQGKKESPVSSSGTTATVCLLQVQTGPPPSSMSSIVPRSCYASSSHPKPPTRGICSSLVLYGIITPIIGHFRAWKPTFLMP